MQRNILIAQCKRQALVAKLRSADFSSTFTDFRKVQIINTERKISFNYSINCLIFLISISIYSIYLKFVFFIDLGKPIKVCGKQLKIPMAH